MSVFPAWDPYVNYGQDNTDPNKRPRQLFSPSSSMSAPGSTTLSKTSYTVSPGQPMDMQQQAMQAAVKRRMSGFKDPTQLPNLNGPQSLAY